MKRIGTLVVFKPEVTTEQAAEALKSIADIIELPETTVDYVPVETRQGVLRYTTYQPVERPFEFVDLIRDYEDDCGSGPTWYIP